MIIEVRVKNCFAFYDPIIFSLKADMRNKRFATNVHRENNFNVLKTAGIYGPNNSGKTCLIKCIRSIKKAMLNNDPGVTPNIFHKDKTCELGVSFLMNGREFAYDFRYNVDKEEYTYEKFCEIIKDQYNNQKEELWLERDSVNSVYRSTDLELSKMMSMVSQSNLLFYQIDVTKFEILGQMKKIVTEFASKIDVINMNNIPMSNTINLMKNKDGLQDKVVDFIRKADLYMDDFQYAEASQIQVKNEKELGKAEEELLDIPERILEQMRLVSVYRGIPVPSMFYDSTGTKKIIAMASYIVEALEQGRVLVVDELDSSLHFKLTRAIVSMFNNELNTDAQLIFTIHDINLLDCKKMFRKEQIWFVHKDEDGVYLYSLGEFTAEQGFRDTTDVMERYRKGVLGALPDPELIKALLSFKRGKNEGEMSDEQNS